MEPACFGCPDTELCYRAGNCAHNYYVIRRPDHERKPELSQPPPQKLEHPAYYGGIDSPHECIKVIEAWQLGFCDGNVLKYIARWRQKGGIGDLKKAQWYLTRFIEQEEAKLK